MSIYLRDNALGRNRTIVACRDIGLIGIGERDRGTLWVGGAAGDSNPDGWIEVGGGLDLV